MTTEKSVNTFAIAKGAERYLVPELIDRKSFLLLNKFKKIFTDHQRKFKNLSVVQKRQALLSYRSDAGECLPGLFQNATSAQQALSYGKNLNEVTRMGARLQCDYLLSATSLAEQIWKNVIAQNSFTQLGERLTQLEEAVNLGDGQFNRQLSVNADYRILGYDQSFGLCGLVAHVGILAGKGVEFFQQATGEQAAQAIHGWTRVVPMFGNQAFWSIEEKAQEPLLFDDVQAVTNLAEGMLQVLDFLLNGGLSKIHEQMQRDVRRHQDALKLDSSAIDKARLSPQVLDYVNAASGRKGDYVSLNFFIPPETVFNDVDSLLNRIARQWAV